MKVKGATDQIWTVYRAVQLLIFVVCLMCIFVVGRMQPSPASVVWAKFCICRWSRLVLMMDDVFRCHHGWPVHDQCCYCACQHRWTVWGIVKHKRLSGMEVLPITFCCVSAAIASCRGLALSLLHASSSGWCCVVAACKWTWFGIGSNQQRWPAGLWLTCRRE